jgi:hypothetical protein
VTPQITFMKQFVKFVTSHHLYYICGSIYAGSIEAPTRKKLLEKMKEFREKHQHEAEVITFAPIKKIVEISEAKGKFTVFRKITNRYTPDRKSLSKFYNEV